MHDLFWGDDKSELRDVTQFLTSCLQRFSSDIDSSRQTPVFLIVDFTEDLRLPKCCLMPLIAPSGATTSVSVRLKANGVSHRDWLTGYVHELNVLFVLSGSRCTVAACCSDRQQIWLFQESKMRWFLLMLFCLITSPVAVSTWNSNHRWIILDTVNLCFLLLKLSSGESGSQSSDSISSSDSTEVRTQCRLSYSNSL